MSGVATVQYRMVIEIDVLRHVRVADIDSYWQRIDDAPQQMQRHALHRRTMCDLQDSTNHRKFLDVHAREKLTSRCTVTRLNRYAGDAQRFSEIVMEQKLDH